MARKDIHILFATTQTLKTSKLIVEQRILDLLVLRLEGLSSHRLSNRQPVEISGGPARYERALMQQIPTLAAEGMFSIGGVVKSGEGMAGSASECGGWSSEGSAQWLRLAPSSENPMSFLPPVTNKILDIWEGEPWVFPLGCYHWTDGRRKRDRVTKNS